MSHLAALRTQALDEQFASTVDAHAERLGVSSSVARVGWDQNLWIQQFQQAVAERAAAKVPPHMELSALIDATISFAHESCENAELPIVDLLRCRCCLWENLQHILDEERQAPGKNPD